MEMYQAYNNINSLLAEIAEKNQKFQDAANKVESELELVKWILEAFSDTFKNIKSPRATFTKNEKIKLYGFSQSLIQPFGEVILQTPNSMYNNESRLYYALKNTTSDELERVLNTYSPEKLEVKDLIVTESNATIRVILKGLKVD